MKSTPTRGVKQSLKPDAYKQLELDWKTVVTCSDLYVPFPHGTGSLSVSKEYLAFEGGLSHPPNSR